MIGSEIVTMFEGLVGDSLDADLAYQLLNDAKDEIEDLRPWEMLKKLDSSQSASTASKSLPTDYRETLLMMVGSTEIAQIPFEQKVLFENASTRWYLDLANDNFYLLGSNLSGTIYHFYKYQTPEITANTSPVWPDRFHTFIAYKMAEIFFAVDQGERGLSWDKEMAMKAEAIRRRMVSWDVNLQKRAKANAVPIGGEPEVFISNFGR